MSECARALCPLRLAADAHSWPSVSPNSASGPAAVGQMLLFISFVKAPCTVLPYMLSLLMRSGRACHCPKAEEGTVQSSADPRWSDRAKSVKWSSGGGARLFQMLNTKHTLQNNHTFLNPLSDASADSHRGGTAHIFLVERFGQKPELLVTSWAVRCWTATLDDPGSRLMGLQSVMKASNFGPLSLCLVRQRFRRLLDVLWLVGPPCTEYLHSRCARCGRPTYFRRCADGSSAHSDTLAQTCRTFCRQRSQAHSLPLPLSL